MIRGHGATSMKSARRPGCLPIGKSEIPKACGVMLSATLIAAVLAWAAAIFISI